MKYFQQGDTLYFLEKKIPEAKKMKTDIVQEGEATGHAHRLHGKGYQLYETPQKEKYLKIVRITDLKHEEHHTIALPPGSYRIGIVREYDHFSEEARRVAD